MAEAAVGEERGPTPVGKGARSEVVGLRVVSSSSP